MIAALLCFALLDLTCRSRDTATMGEEKFAMFYLASRKEKRTEEKRENMVNELSSPSVRSQIDAWV